MAEQTHAYKTLCTERDKLKSLYEASAVQLQSLDRQRAELADIMAGQQVTIIELEQTMEGLFVPDPDPEVDPSEPFDEGWVDDPQNPHA